MKRQIRSVSFMFLWALLCGAADPNATIAPFDEYYGIYVQGQKVGWMRSRLALSPQPVMSTELHARVAGMGQEAEIELTEERQYTGLAGLLERISFKQRAATGQVQVIGKRKENGILALDVQAGGATRSQELTVNERFTDAAATYRLARQAKVGSAITAVHFDPSIQKVLQVDYKVMAVERRNFGGVEIQAVKLMSTYPELRVSEVAWLDNVGKVLESRIGQFFVARLEPVEVAKRLDYHQDLLVSAVVRAPRVLIEPQSLQSLTLQFTGFGEDMPPSTTRQVVTRDGPVTTMALRRDPLPPRTPLGSLSKQASNPNSVPPDVLQALEPTAFIQSDAPELVAAAKKAVGDAKDVFAASTRLASFVYKHVRSEYVPAYSNALESYRSARGDCTEHSILFVALARAAGIPARVAVGIAYWPPGDGFGWHAWAEIWVAGRWLAVDPTWNQPVADATHVKLADGGPAEQARIVMLLGELKIVDMKGG